MEKLKKHAEMLNNLYFKINGVYSGVVKNLKRNNVSSQEVDFLLESLNPNYIGAFLEEVDDYVIDVINYGLNVDFGYFVEVDSNLSNCDLEKLYSRVNTVAGHMCKQISDVESKLYKIDSKISDLGACCEEMRSVLNQIDESLFVINNQVKQVCFEPLSE